MLGYASLWAANGPTPATNRGLISQKVEVSCDYLTFHLDNVPDTATAIGILSRVEEFYSERLEVRFDRKMRHGRMWDGGSISSQRGVQCYWANPSMGRSGQLMFVVPGKPIKTRSQADNRLFLLMLFEDYKGRFSRFDIAVDDFGKTLDFDRIERDVDEENYFFTNTAQVVRSYKRGRLSTGKTIYFGSKQSDKMVRIYDKSAESGGEIDSHRVEAQFRAKFAEMIGGEWLAMIQEESQAIAQWLVSIVTGCVEFRNRISKNRERCPLVQWWADFLELLKAAPLRVSLPKKTPCLVRTMDALERQYGSMLVVIYKALGDVFDGWLCQVLESGEERLGTRHRALLSLAKDENLIECALQ